MSKWKTIPGYTRYEVSDDGNIRHVVYKRIRKPRIDKSGYLAYCLHHDESGTWKMMYAHRLVYMAFVGEIPDNTYIDHVNRVRDDNRLENLRATTRLVNANNKKPLISPVSLRRIEYIINQYNAGLSPTEIHETLKKRPV